MTPVQKECKSMNSDLDVGQYATQLLRDGRITCTTVDNCCLKSTGDHRLYGFHSLSRYRTDMHI